MKLLKNTGRFVDKMLGREVVFTTRTDHNHYLEVVKSRKGLVLNSSNANYSFGSLHNLFQHVFEKANVLALYPKKVLILGFGAGSVARILQEEYSIPCQITGVEKDPAVIRIAEQYFDLGNRPDINIIIADALEWIPGHQALYDLVVVDIYRDFEVPAECETDAFIDHVIQRLVPGGWLIFNKMIYNEKAAAAANRLKNLFAGREGGLEVINIRKKISNWVYIYINAERNSG